MISLRQLAQPPGVLALLVSSNLKPDCTVDNFPEYAAEVHSLDASQQLHVRNLAFSIYQSQRSPFPVRAVLSVGNADTALRLTGIQRSAMETEVSWKRARSGAMALRDELVQIAGHPSIAHMILIKALGIGAMHKVVQNANTEVDMKRNRRVEYFLVRENVGLPNCACRN